MSINKSIGKHIMVIPYNRILLCNRQERTTYWHRSASNNMSEPQNSMLSERSHTKSVPILLFHLYKILEKDTI